MNKQIAILVVGVVVLVAAYAAHNFVQARSDCEKPSGNSKLCYDPGDAVSSCTTTSQTQCKGAVYSISSFPKGTTEADTGRTKEVLAGCYYYKPCVWSTQTKTCGTADPNDWSQVFQKPKIVAMDYYEMNWDDPCKGGE